MLLELLQLQIDTLLPKGITRRHCVVEIPLNPANKIRETNIYKLLRPAEWGTQLTDDC